jgi:hypothetical protein
MVIRSLDAVLPSDVPADTLVADWLRQHPRCIPTQRSECPHGNALTNRAMAQDIAAILASLPAAGKVIKNPAGQPDDLAHDAFFHVRRLKQDEPAVFVHSIFSARLTFLQDVYEQAVTIDRADLELIDRGFSDLLSCLSGGTVNESTYVNQWHAPSATCLAMNRWVHGHLIFALLSQGLILSFRSLGQALRAGKSEKIQKWADLSISLLKASGAAFVFTGDFPPGEYENTIRPSMTPPISPIGLSGLMSADHRHMAQTIRDMRPALMALAEQEPERHDRLAGAVADVYDRHIFVCERFVGSRPSILTAGRTERSGPSLIEQFKTLRLKPFEHAQRATRLTAEHSSTALGECPFKK